MIQINGKTYRNLQEQVAKNTDDIEDLLKSVEDITDSTYSKTDIDNKDAAVLTEAKAYTYSKTEIDNKDANTLTVALGSAKTYTDNMITAVENTHYSISQADYKFLAKTALTDNSILEAHIGNSVIDADNVDLMAVTSQDVYGRVSVEPTSTIIKNSSGTDVSQIGISATEIDVTTGTFKYNSHEVATTDQLFSGDYDDLTNKPTIPDAVSGTNDGTNWTTLTIGNSTYGIGGSSTPTMYNHVINIEKTSSSSTNCNINVQFNNFNNTQINSISAFMTAYANHSIPYVLVGSGWGTSSSATSLCPFDKATIDYSNNRIELRFTNPDNTGTPVVYYFSASSSGYTITDTVTPISA